MFILALFMCFAAFTAAYDDDRRFVQMEALIQQLRDENKLLRLHYEAILHQNAAILHQKADQQKRIEHLEAYITKNYIRETNPYNVTIEELEIRVERLEEDMFQAQADIGEAELDINSLEFSLQETIETVMDHADNLDQLGQDIINLETNTEGLDNRTTNIEQSIVILESDIEGLDVRTANIEQILSERKDFAFYATLSADVVFVEDRQRIIFDNDKINEGAHYNITTGRYTAPVAGIYQFFAYIKASPKANFHTYVDGSSYANLQEDDTEDDTESEGTSILIRLQADQIVDVRTGDTAYTVHGNSAGQVSWFGGYLLFRDTE